MKNIKKVLCLLLIVLLSFSLIGCNAIEEMRKAQIHFNDNNDLIIDGKAYKLLPICEDFSPDFALNETLFITEKDVPVLLSSMYGDEAYLSSDKKFVYTFSKKDYNDIYYAREDVYDEIVERINSGDYFDGYCFAYTYYDEEADANPYKTKYEFLSTEAQNAIDETLKGTPEEDVDTSLLYQFDYISILLTSNDEVFFKGFVDIYKTEKFIYVIDEYENVFKATEEYFTILDGIINRYNLLDSSYNYYSDSDVYFE